MCMWGVGPRAGTDGLGPGGLWLEGSWGRDGPCGQGAVRPGQSEEERLALRPRLSQPVGAAPPPEQPAEAAAGSPHLVYRVPESKRGSGHTASHCLRERGHGCLTAAFQ